MLELDKLANCNWEISLLGGGSRRGKLRSCLPCAWHPARAFGTDYYSLQKASAPAILAVLARGDRLPDLDLRLVIVAGGRAGEEAEVARWLEGEIRRYRVDSGLVALSPSLSLSLGLSTSPG